MTRVDILYAINLKFVSRSRFDYMESYKPNRNVRESIKESGGGVNSERFCHRNVDAVIGKEVEVVRPPRTAKLLGSS